jgi:hypothetical protein
MPDDKPLLLHRCFKSSNRWGKGVQQTTNLHRHDNVELT